MPWLDAHRSALRNTAVSPLYHTSLLGLEQLSKRLIEAKADPNASGGLFGSPLLAAAYRGHEGIVRALLKVGAKTNSGEGLCGYETPLMVAAAGGHEMIVRALIHRGADINHVSLGEGTALSCAAQNGYGKIVQILLDAGADPDM